MMNSQVFDFNFMAFVCMSKDLFSVNVSTADSKT